MAFAHLTYRESLRDTEASFIAGQALALGIPWPGGVLDAGGRERIARLARLR
jgi:hypothetical protein